mmetsp:Transcript_4952/g.14900  ORF Transcript_4952/g.14900 Transcript_4952/m.14900 type:complete len:292 (-) Transcript_4952:1615-2490(-)
MEVESIEEEKDTRVVRMENVHKTYLMGINGVAVLRGVSLEVRRGEFVAIYGPSGSGKSTMLSLMGTIDRHSKGDLYLFGHRITLNTKDSFLADLRLRDIGFVFQAFNLLPTLSAFENVELPMVLAGKSREERTTRALKLLDRVGMSHRAKNYPAQLSGGEQQRVTIARALANRPSLLLMDEPSGDLDTKNTDQIMDFLLDLHEKQKITMVMVTHDVGLRSYADRVVQFRDGKVVGDVKIPAEQRMRMRKSLREQVIRTRANPEASKAKSVRKLEVEVRHPEDYMAAATELQ